jgi:hypothetical protein
MFAYRDAPLSGTYENGVRLPFSGEATMKAARPNCYNKIAIL